jgi:urease accessory protein
MELVRDILGSSDDPRFAGRRIEELPLDWAEASKGRLRRRGEAGTDIAIDLPRGGYLADGAVLADDGERIVVVRRRRERALVVHLDAAAGQETLVRAAVLLGHALGNQHAPVEIEGLELRVPLTTSEEVALATVQRLGLTGARTEIAEVALGAHGPLAAGHAHGGGHPHGGGDSQGAGAGDARGAGGGDVHGPGGEHGHRAEHEHG